MDIKLNKDKRGQSYNKFTKENVDAILLRISRYVPYEIACVSQGVAAITFERWMDQGKLDLANGIDSDFANLYLRLAELKVAKIDENVGKILSDRRSHLGAQFILSRRFSQYFSDKTEVLELNERMDKWEKENRVKGMENGQETKEMDSSNAHEKGCPP